MKRYRYADDGVNPSVGIIRAVAAATDRAATELPPLYDRVNADALDELMANGRAGDVRVSFTYAGVEVTVTGDGDVFVSGRP